MSIKKYKASKDNTITNAFAANLLTRSEKSNMGASDTMEIFTIYAQGVPVANDAGEFERGEDGKIIQTTENARILIEFPVDDIAQDIADGELPPSGAVYKLNLYNAPHELTLPDNFTVEIFPISKSWSEGIGLDMEEYSDKGASGGGIGSDWNSADIDTSWDTAGGDYVDDGYKKTFFFKKGTEDLEVDISDIVQAWLDGDLENYGLLLKLESGREQALAKESTYTKRFFARGSEYFYKRPCISAEWNSSKKDDRGNFYAESLLRGEEDNTNIIYFTNIVSGAKKNIPTVTSGGDNDLTIKIYSDSTRETELEPETLTVTNDITGEYKASLVLDTELESIYVDWEDAGGQIYYSEDIEVLSRKPTTGEPPVYVSNITNMKSVYSNTETATFRLYTRLKDWNPTIYTVSSKNIENTIVENAFFRIVRVVDEEVIIAYGDSTMLSYDVDGNYFHLDMSLLEPDFAYRVELQYEIGENLQQQPETFKFRVE